MFLRFLKIGSEVKYFKIKKTGKYFEEIFENQKKIKN